MRIFNVKVYGLDEALVRAGYPKALTIKNMQDALEEGGYVKRVERGITLGNAKVGSGHDKYLKGIVVQADIEAPAYWWPQWDQYHFQDCISSQSVMHCATRMDFNKICPEVDPRILDVVAEYQDLLRKGLISKSVFRKQVPEGRLSVRAITTNYLQGKTMRNQRRPHELEEWQYVCDWWESLPMFVELCLGGGKLG